MLFIGSVPFNYVVQFKRNGKSHEEYFFSEKWVYKYLFEELDVNDFGKCDVEFYVKKFNKKFCKWFEYKLDFKPKLHKAENI